MSLGLGLLIVRVLFGAAIAAHGTQKLFGWFGGYGLQGTGGFFVQNNGFEPAFLYGAVAVGLALTGAGAYSFDNELQWTALDALSIKVGLLVVSIVGATLTLAVRKQPAQQTTAG